MNDIETLSDTYREDVQGVIPTKWSKLVEEAARPKRVFRNYIRFNNELLNREGDSVNIPRRGTLTAAAIAEGGTIIPEALTVGTALTLTPTEYGVAVKISRQAVERTQINLLQDATEELGQSMAQIEDEIIRDAINEATSNVLYGNDATGTADIATGDVLTPQLLAKAIKEVRKNNFEPSVIFIAPEQEWQLGTTDQFVNAATYGARDFIKSGKIANYLGVDVRVTTNVPSGTGGISTATPYHTCLLMDGLRAAALALKRNISIDKQYLPLERKHIVAATLDMDAGLLQDAAVCKITCSDA